MTNLQPAYVWYNNINNYVPDVSGPGNCHDQERHQVNGDLRRQQELDALPQLLQRTDKSSHVYNPSYIYNPNQLENIRNVKDINVQYLIIFHLCMGNR